MTGPVNITLIEVVSFILRYRRGNAFKDETPDELKTLLSIAVEQHCMLVDSDDFGKINGVIIAHPFVDYNRLHIHGILCNSSKCLANFAYWLQQHVERRNWTLTATRRGKLVEYRTQSLLKRLVTLYGTKSK